MIIKPQTKEEYIAEQRPRLIHAVATRLSLYRRIPDLFRKRGWPQDDALIGVAMVSIACMKLGANFTWVKRPPSASELKGLWPEKDQRVTVKQVVDTLDLDDLLKPA